MRVRVRGRFRVRVRGRVAPHLGGACGRAREAACGQVGPSDDGVRLRLEGLAIIPLGRRQVAPGIRT